MLSWNVNGLSALKKDDPDFVEFLAKFDVIFLYETSAAADSDLKLSGYCSHNFYRKFQHRNARRCSGGVAVFYREELQDGIQIVSNKHDSLIWLNLDRFFFRVENDIYLSGIYLWPEGSPAYTVLDVDFFDILEQDINIYSELGSVYIAGDFNSRIGRKSDFIIHDYISAFDDENYIPDKFLRRASLGNKCNNFGSRLIELCKSLYLRVVNGRLYHDFNVGAFTFVNNNCAFV